MPRYPIFIFTLLVSLQVHAGDSSALIEEIERHEASNGTTIGLAAIHLKSGDVISHNGDRRVPDGQYLQDTHGGLRLSSG